MAHFDKESGKIILSVEDEEILKEANVNTQDKRTPVTDSIIKKLLNLKELNWKVEDLAD